MFGVGHGPVCDVEGLEEGAPQAVGSQGTNGHRSLKTQKIQFRAEKVKSWPDRAYL